MRKILTLTLMILALVTPAYAIDFTASGTILTVTYLEPTLNTDKTILNDLLRTSVYYSLNGATDVKVVDVPASSAAGGGPISTTVVIPIAVGQSASVTIRATATDTSGNESTKSVAVTKTIDRLSPMPPS